MLNEPGLRSILAITRRRQWRRIAPRFPWLALGFITLATALSAVAQTTTVSFQGEKFFLNGLKTYSGGPLDGTLPNSRMVNATLEDANSATVSMWKYPDGSAYDPVRQTNEFVAALPGYRAKGLLAVSLNFQGGRPTAG